MFTLNESVKPNSEAFNATFTQTESESLIGVNGAQYRVNTD